MTGRLVWLCLVFVLAAWPSASFAQGAYFQAFVGSPGTDDSTCQNPADPCASLEYALGHLASGGVLIISAGRFAAPDDITGSVEIRGIGPGTIISDGNAQTTFNVTEADVSLVLRDLTIRCAYTCNGVAGVDFANGIYLNLENVTISNQTGVAGNGIRFRTPQTATLRMRNVVVENSEGAAVVVGPSSGNRRIDISDSSFDTNLRGIEVFGGGHIQLSLSNSTVSNAAGDGIYIGTGGATTRLTIQNSKVVNSAGTGLLIAPTGSAKVNTTVIGSALDGNVIGIRSFPGGNAVSNVTISDTSASNNAGGIHASGKSVVSIIRGAVGGNSSYGVGAISPAAVRIGSSVVGGNTLGFSGPISSYGNNQLHGNTNPGSSTPLPPGSVP